MSKPPSRADEAYTRLLDEARRRRGSYRCRVLTQGHRCTCELCDLDFLNSEIQRLKQALFLQQDEVQLKAYKDVLARIASARIASAPIADDPAILRETLVVCRRLAKDTIT